VRKPMMLLRLAPRLWGRDGSVFEGFTCEVYEDYRYEDYLSACEGLDFYAEHEGKRYCVLHCPGEKNKEDFEEVKKSKLARQDYDFGGTVFPEGTSDFRGVEFDTDTYFPDATFIGGAQFRDATFSGERTSFEGAEFGSAETYFPRVQFSSSEGTSFEGAQFSGEYTNFLDAQFSGERTDFRRVKFGSASTLFSSTSFAKEVVFGEATFGERVSFWGTKANLVFASEAWATFDSVRIEKPEQFMFNTVLLHPAWFINADVRKVDFTDVKWYGMPGEIPEGTLDEEIHALEDRRVQSPHTLLAQACRRLSANAEENREYPLANEFHYWSMDAVRKGSWGHFKGLSLKGLLNKETWHDIREHFGLITTLYWALSRYGVRATRAFWILFAIWLMFAALYFLFVVSSPFLVFSASDIWEGIDYARQAAVYSLSALVRLNPRPQSEELNWFQTLVTIEGILGPLRIALLVLAIRRKVMR
jgi:uncharacterized protein YjbI with pentapeptide repeats